tara:strand:- start:2802 stop:2978 length:177 start_codon:yes stop_codon:yes gene_type:complete
MNKQKISEIKKIINYDPSIKEHKRMLRRLKKEYQKLPKGSKVNLIEDLKRTFNKEKDE